MRVILALLLLLTFGCEEPTPEAAKRESTFVGDWVSVGTSESERIKVSFTDDGKVTLTPGKNKPLSLRYRVETFEAWYARRRTEISVPTGELEEPFPNVTHVVTAFDEARPKEFNPSRNFFYEKAADKLNVSGMIEFRRVQ